MLIDNTIQNELRESGNVRLIMFMYIYEFWQLCCMKTKQSFSGGWVWLSEKTVHDIWKMWWLNAFCVKAAKIDLEFGPPWLLLYEYVSELGVWV